MIIDEEVYLKHFGVKGMHWGVRHEPKRSGKSKSSGDRKQKWGKQKNAAVVLGSVAAAGAIAAGSIFAKQHLSEKLSNTSKSPGYAKKFAESLANEPVGIAHSSRGLNRGYAFLRDGGMKNLDEEFGKAFGDGKSPGYFNKYPDGKVASVFADPLGRKDFSGRPILHDVILPPSIGKHLYNSWQVEEEIWPDIKDLFGAYYQSKPKTYGPGY